MAAYVLSPERWRELSAASSPAVDNQQATPRRMGRVFYESHTPVSSPVAVNIHHQVIMGQAEEEDDPAGVIAVERFLPQRRSPGQRSQDSGFSGYSGDSASEGSSNNNSPVPAAGSGASAAGKRSPLSDPEDAERALAEPQKMLETDVDATPSRGHVSRIYIRNAEEAAIDLRDVLCEKKIQPVNLSGSEASSSSPDKCVGDKNLISAVLASTNSVNRNNLDADRSCDSQTGLLMEHKSIVPPASMRPNISWKKLSESFRRVISSGRLMTASQLPADESEDSRLIIKRSNLKRPIKADDGSDREDADRVPALPESPQPTNRYLGGPRSSTPRKTMPPRRTLPNNRCSRLDGDRPRVHWADADPTNNNNNIENRKPVISVTDNSTWDSDTPSLEIGQQVAPVPVPVASASVAALAVLTPGEPRRRRGLRMGVGVDRSLNASGRKVPPVIPPPVVPVIPAPIEFQTSTAALYQQLPNGLRWSPVEAWLKDLPMFYQPESTCALQNKAIQQTSAAVRTSGCFTSDESGSDSSNAIHSTSHQSDDEDRTYSATVTARAQVRRLQRRAHLISTEFAQLCSFIELYEESKLTALIPLFLAHVIQFIREAESAAVAPEHCPTGAPPAGDDLIVTLRQTCAHLVQIVNYNTAHLCTEPALTDMEPANAPPPPVNWSLARQITAKLGQVFVAIVDTFVGREIQVLTSALKSGKCVSAARLAANSLMSLGSDAARPALRPLVEAFRIGHLRPVRADLLRALSALCSSADIIQEFELCGGLSVIFDVLCGSGSADDEEKSEAAGLLAQITSPWLDPPMEEPQAALIDQQQIVNPWPTLHLTPYISSFIAALTELSAQTDAEETLLLSTAALANLTFSHSEAVQLMAKYRTAHVLVQASGLRKNLSVFIQDQIATILANMAAVYSVRAELVAHGALATLVGFLQLRPSPVQRPAEVTASERVLKKSAIALSRVCGEENAAREIVELHGIERIAQLVRDPRERNYSDGVLVACLAALHKIATACGTDELERRGAADLIENRLLDVFLEYSTRPESYV